MKKQIKVVGVIIENSDNEILCALRSPTMALPNHWEFPGGKLEANEHSKLIWLKRENLNSLIWAPADLAAVEQLIGEKV